MSDSNPPHVLGEILDLAPCGFLRFRDNGAVIRVNATLSDMLDLPVPEMEGQNISTILSQPGKVFFQTHFFPSLRMHGRVKELYLSLRGGTGRIIPVLINAVRRSEHDDAYNDCVIVEIVGRERLEDALLQAKNESEGANRSKEIALLELKEAMGALALAKEETEAASRAKDDFLAALSHELRTPLTPVLLIASELEEDASLSPNIREKMSVMRRNIELEATLIDDLLDVNRIRHGKLTLDRSQVDIHGILEQAKEIVQHDCDAKEIMLSIRAEAIDHYVSGDSARIHQVIWNLLKNAIKFTPRYGSITASTRNDEQQRVVVEVKDSGIGIPSGQLAKIFNRFEQGHAAGQHRFGGLGLGLSIAQAIVSAHDGDIHAQSEGEGSGATFSFCLETVKKPDLPSRPVPADSRPDEGRNILLVEDHVTTRLVLSRTLIGLKHQVTDVGTLAEAREAFESDTFDLIISDLGLPDGSGLDLMKAIRSCSSVPSIALSGYGMPEDLRQIEQAGFSAHLVKPIKVDHLLALMREMNKAPTTR